MRVRDSRASTLERADDVELIGMLRSGDDRAYTELWRRHIAAALRRARRIAPSHAEDLVSESFLAVYQQITVSGSGPRSSFRPYLFAVMRNTAISWWRAESVVGTAPDLDGIDTEDGLARLEDRAAAAELLEAFQSLPPRWQRVLWLAEIEEASRAQIAREFGIKPNAVSALHRRARRGLRVSWMLQQVPPELREDGHHVARLLPKLVAAGPLAGRGREVSEHLAVCGACARVEAELRHAHRSMQKGGLAVAGFAALGVVLPAAAQAPLVVSGTATAIGIAGGAGIGTAIAAGVGVIAAGGLLTTTLILGAPGGDNRANADTGAGQQSGRGSSQTEQPQDGRGSRSGEDGRDRSPGVSQQGSGLGRGNTDPAVQSIGFDPHPDYEAALPDPPPQRRAPAKLDPDAIPGPSHGPGSPGSGLSAGLDAPAASSGYFAPVVSGTTEPGASVAIEIRGGQYLADVEGSGGWSFDLRELSFSTPGDYAYRVWAFTGSEQSAVEEGAFTLLPIEVAGFEGIAAMDIGEASGSGLVIEIRGLANGTVCLTSVFSDQTAQIGLDPSGVALRRIRFLAGGFYYLKFQSCDGALTGAEAEAFLDVQDPDTPVFGPWGPDPADARFELDPL